MIFSQLSLIYVRFAQGSEKTLHPGRVVIKGKLRDTDRKEGDDEGVKERGADMNCYAIVTIGDENDVANGDTDIEGESADVKYIGEHEKYQRKRGRIHRERVRDGSEGQATEDCWLLAGARIST